MSNKIITDKQVEGIHRAWKRYQRGEFPMKKFNCSISKVVQWFLYPQIYRATYYGTRDFVIKATRRHKAGRGKVSTVELVVTYGKPNYKEHNFIKKCIKAGEKFPIKKIQLEFYKA